MTLWQTLVGTDPLYIGSVGGVILDGTLTLKQPRMVTLCLQMEMLGYKHKYGGINGERPRKINPFYLRGIHAWSLLNQTINK